MPRTKNSARLGGAKRLVTALCDDRMRSARCKLFPELPWTADVAPEGRLMRRMRECCAGCPVRLRCEEVGAQAQGGFYAGVWLPWKADKGVSGVRSARRELRARVSARAAV